MEICHNRERDLTQNDLDRLKKALIAVIFSHIAKRQPEVCERIALKGVGDVLITNSGNPYAYALIIDEYSDYTVSSLEELPEPKITVQKDIIKLNLSTAYEWV